MINFIYAMTRKFKQWRSTILQISTKRVCSLNINQYFTDIKWYFL